MLGCSECSHKAHIQDCDKRTQRTHLQVAHFAREPLRYLLQLRYLSLRVFVCMREGLHTDLQILEAEQHAGLLQSSILYHTYLQLLDTALRLDQPPLPLNDSRLFRSPQLGALLARSAQLCRRVVGRAPRRAQLLLQRCRALWVKDQVCVPRLRNSSKHMHACKR